MKNVNSRFNKNLQRELRMETYTLKIESLTLSNAMAIASLQLNREVSRTEMAEALEISRQYANNIKDRTLSEDQIAKIEKALKINLCPISSNSASSDKIEIHYWGKGLPCEEKLKNPYINSMWFDREVINNGWQKDENNLNIIAMPGDKMDGGDIPFKNGDILLIDKTQTDISISGIYFYTTNNNEDIFVNNFRKRFDGTIVLGFTNSKYEDSIVTIDQLEAAGYKVIGRVIKNIFAII